MHALFVGIPLGNLLEKFLGEIELCVRIAPVPPKVGTDHQAGNSVNPWRGDFVLFFRFSLLIIGDFRFSVFRWRGDFVSLGIAPVPPQDRHQSSSRPFSLFVDKVCVA